MPKKIYPQVAHTSAGAGRSPALLGAGISPKRSGGHPSGKFSIWHGQWEC